MKEEKKGFYYYQKFVYKKYISDITIKDNLKYLYQTLKDLLSQEIVIDLKIMILILTKKIYQRY